MFGLANNESVNVLTDLAVGCLINCNTPKKKFKGSGKPCINFVETLKSDFNNFHAEQQWDGMRKGKKVKQTFRFNCCWQKSFRILFSNRTTVTISNRGGLGLGHWNSIWFGKDYLIIDSKNKLSFDIRFYRKFKNFFL